MSNFKENILNLLNEREISIKDFCDSLNLGKNAVYDFDKHLPSVETAIKISKFFDLSIDYLLGRGEDASASACDEKNFYGNLTKLLAEEGLSKRKFIEKLHLSRDAFTRWKNGQTPRLSTLIDIADYFACAVDELML